MNKMHTKIVKFFHQQTYSGKFIKISEKKIFTYDATYMNTRKMHHVSKDTKYALENQKDASCMLTIS